MPTPMTIQATPYRTIEEEIAAFYMEAVSPSTDYSSFDTYMCVYDYIESFLNLGSFEKENFK